MARKRGWWQTYKQNLHIYMYMQILYLWLLSQWQGNHPESATSGVDLELQGVREF